jgi:hypothetical protein
LWTPGYWSWDDDDGYYWVPGTWVLAPVGTFWTPSWWEWNEGLYVFHGGYWGPHVGFYGGIDYGFGYTGEGFYGGEWRGRDFYYNRSVTNVNVTNITNVYNQTVIVNNTTVNHVSYNGGNGGIEARPTAQQLAAEHERHQAPLPIQTQHQQGAARNRELFASVNRGRPPVAATARPADFHSAVPARAAGAPYRAPEISPREARGPAVAGNRPLTATNSNNVNRTANRPINSPNPRNNSKANSPRNDGFRPFTPPTRANLPNHSSDYSRPASSPRPNDRRTSTNRPFADRPSDNRPTRELNHPPSASRLSNSRAENFPRPQNESRPQSAPRPPQAQGPTRELSHPPSASRLSNSRAENFPRPQNESRPQSAPRPPQAQGPTRELNRPPSASRSSNSRAENLPRPQNESRPQSTPPPPQRH